MFKAIKDDKVIAINDSGKFPHLIYNKIKEDDKHKVEDFIECNGEFFLKTSTKSIEAQKERVKKVRNKYLEIYVDVYQCKPLLWEEMSDEEKDSIRNYRKYLKDYTDEKNWWKSNPMTFDEWQSK